MLIYDILGYLSVFFSLLAFLSENKQKIRLYGIFSIILFGISIYGYQGYNGAFVAAVSFISKVLAYFIKEEKLSFLKYIAPVLSVIFFIIFNKEGFIGILPAVSLIFIIYGDIQKDVLKMKIIYYGSVFSWLFYAICLNSITAIIYDILGFLILSYSILKIKKQSKY